MMKLNRKGFTLVEIMIVVAIIALLAAIAIPNLLRARVNANETAAISAMKTIASAAISYRTGHSAYPATLGELDDDTPPYIDSVLAGGSKQGYTFTLVGAANTFTAGAIPTVYQTTGVRSFFVAEDGVVRHTDSGGVAATSAADPIE